MGASDSYLKNPNVEILEETLEIFERGDYRLGGEKVKLKLSPEERESAVYFCAEDVAKLREKQSGDGPFILGHCHYEVVNADSFTAACALNADRLSHGGAMGKQNVLVLNFANPVSPGGGVRRGARAQEEDLCRKSSLLLSLESEAARTYYVAHRRQRDDFASDAILLSPQVEIIRDENNGLLRETEIVAVLTCAAPMLRIGRSAISQEGLKKLLYNRIMGMLQVAAHGGYSYFVLGAWGCGAFGNDPELMSDLFYEALKNFRFGKLRESDVFRHIVFAVLDRTSALTNYRAFQRNFEHF